MPLDELQGTMTREQLQAMRGNWPQRYRVRKIVGATTPKIDTYLTEQQAQDYCDSLHWSVEITAP